MMYNSSHKIYNPKYWFVNEILLIQSKFEFNNTNMCEYWYMERPNNGQRINFSFSFSKLRRTDGLINGLGTNELLDQRTEHQTDRKTPSHRDAWMDIKKGEINSFSYMSSAMKLFHWAKKMYEDSSLALTCPSVHWFVCWSVCLTVCSRFCYKDA